MSKISSLEGLAIMPAVVRWDEFECAIVESPDRIEFVELSAETHATAAMHPRGLAFGPRAELRWQRRAKGLHVVYISDDNETLGEGSDPVDLTEAAGREPAEILLWGEKERGGTEFQDGRIPRLLDYGRWGALAPEGGRLAVRIKHYDLEGVSLYRCVELREVGQAR